MIFWPFHSGKEPFGIEFALKSLFFEGSCQIDGLTWLFCSIVKEDFFTMMLPKLRLHLALSL